MQDLNLSAPELIGTVNVRTNQNTAKFETTNEKMIGAGSPNSDLDQNSGYRSYGIFWVFNYLGQ